MGRDQRKVFVVHGRDSQAKRAVFDFLRALDLAPVSWNQATNATGKATPHTLDAVLSGLATAQAVIVIFSNEESVALHDSLVDGKKDEAGHQPRPNVLIEAGMALSSHRAETIIVEIGALRSATDLDGLNAIRLRSGSFAEQNQLKSRLETAGCAVNPHDDWFEMDRFKAAITAAEDRSKPPAVAPATPPTPAKVVAPAPSVAPQAKSPPNLYPGFEKDFRLVDIPAGRFVMGSPPDEEGRHENETQHPVTIGKPFRMMVYPVTQRLWQAVMGNNPSTFQGPDLPVTDVSWHDAQAFLTKLNGLLKPSAPYRLPTEAEWEYACRAGTTGARYGELDRIAWHGGNSGGKLQPVGTMNPNSWGLYDTLGNVWEWCEDWFGEYPKQGVVDPQGPTKGDSRVLRGGSWNDGPADARASSRVRFNPGYRLVGYGFRCAQ